MAENEHGLSDKWDEVGKDPIWEFVKEGAGAKFFGVYIGKEENVGPNSSNLYSFIRYKDQDFLMRDVAFSIWATTLLDTRFKNFVRGEQVAIIYLGQKASEQRKGASYHNFEVYHTSPEKAVDLDREVDVANIGEEPDLDTLLEE